MLPNVAFKSPPMTLPNRRARSAKIHRQAENDVDSCVGDNIHEMGHSSLERWRLVVTDTYPL